MSIALPISKLRQVGIKIRKKMAAKAVILMYHRVAEVERDPWQISVTPENFAHHLEVLRNSFHPLSLAQLDAAKEEIPPRAVVVTFDDGYRDNLEQAKPLLEKYQIPATFFIATGYLGKQREFWWDELEAILLNVGTLPTQLDLQVNDNTYSWQLGEAANYSATQQQSDRSILPWLAQPDSRLYFFYSVWQQLRRLSVSERNLAMEQIIAWANVDISPRQDNLPLTPEEVKTLAAGNSIEIGAHTVTHPFLAERSPSIQNQEIAASKTYLEQLLNTPITSFSYPFGNYAPETVAIVQKLGFSRACTTAEDSVWRMSDRFELPRCQVCNWEKVEFKRRLNKFFQ